MLRVKIKSLAEEARIIRKEEQRTHGQLRNELHLHRVGTVRNEARHTHIAYGLLRGRTLEQIEQKCYVQPDMKRVEAMLKRYGPIAQPGRAAISKIDGTGSNPDGPPTSTNEKEGVMTT